MTATQKKALQKKITAAYVALSAAAREMEKYPEMGTMRRKIKDMHWEMGEIARDIEEDK